MASTADIKNGLCLEYNGGLWQVIEFLHVKPGKGPAFVRTKLKNIQSGKVVDNTFPSGTKLTTARIERRHYQYLYKDDTGYNFMNTETFEQVSLSQELVKGSDFLKEGDTVETLVHAETGEYLTVELPQFVTLEVTYTEPGVKGNTATNASKPATLETGAEINVPIFINQGEKIKVDTANKCYVERVKE